MTDRQIFIDIDGVLADFISAAFTVHGSHYDETTYPRMEWSIANVLGITEDQFWAKIDDAAPHFWPKLSLYSWSHALVAQAQISAESVAFLSTPSLHPSSHYGKRQWVSKHFPKIELILCKSKHLLAGPNRLLIDDNDGNVTKWRKAGGIAILFPQPWNSNHELCNDPYYAHVANQLDDLDFGLNDPNPKDVLGRQKSPLRLVPSALSIQVANVMKLGAEKYGEYNWRKKRVLRTVYLEAAMRHLLAALDGADADPESKSPHEAHVAACMGIVLDAMATGNLIDDRPTPGAATQLMEALA